MGYGVKWVEDNLGISRKALRCFEAKRLMPENKNKKSRDYSDEDIDRIWVIRLFQGMGYSLDEIRQMFESEDFDFEGSLENKICELKKRKEEVEKHLGYAETIKLTGRFPVRPKKGAASFTDFQENAYNEWNVNSDPLVKRYKEVADLYLNKTLDEWKDTDIGKMLSLFEDISNQLSTDYLMIERIIPFQILKRKENEPSDPEIQLLVKIWYENRKSLCDLTVDQFVRLESMAYVVGDIARLKERDYGKEGCIFIANAIAIFGGYECFDAIYEYIGIMKTFKEGNNNSMITDD